MDAPTVFFVGGGPHFGPESLATNVRFGLWTHAQFVARLLVSNCMLRCSAGILHPEN